MKKIIFTITYVVMFLPIFSQQATSTEVNPIVQSRKHELGIDVSNFIKTYLNTSTSSPFNPSLYMISYRRYFAKSNFRSAIGGNYFYQESDSPYNGDSLNKKFYDRRNSFMLRAGYEFFQNLSQRWQVFYGADLSWNYTHSRNDTPFFTGGYANGTETTTNSYAFTPLLGLRFRINQRVSLTTETYFSVYSEETSSFRYYEPTRASLPRKEDTPKTTSLGIKTSFTPPFFLILTVSL